MEDGKKCTWLIVRGTSAVLGIYDVYAYWRWGDEATISRVIAAHITDHPVWAFVAGVVCGHLFWIQVVKGIKDAVDK